MARAMWKGRIQLGDQEVPVKMYSAIEPRRVQFRLMHREKLAPVAQKIVRKIDGEDVPKEERFKAYPLSGGGSVILTSEDLAELEPPPSRSIELCRFVPRSLLSDQWYDRPYFLGPDDDASSYFALARALGRREVEGIARWVMRKKRYVGSLQAIGGYLMMVTLRRADQVVAVRNVQVSATRQPDEKELAMAEQLVGMLEGDFDHSEWRDEYRERVRSLVESKSRGETFVVEAPEKPRAEGGLAEALEQSLSAAKEKKVA